LPAFLIPVNPALDYFLHQLVPIAAIDNGKIISKHGGIGALTDNL